jgi:hypothetical protein
VDVLNGTDVYKLATRNSLQLKKLGFKIDVVDSTDAPVSATTVLYPPAHQAGAKALAKAVPGAKLVMSSAVARVTLQLGTNGKQVTGLTPATGSTSPPVRPAGKKPVVTCID